MNAKERVLETLQGGSVDRVPLNVFAGWNPGVRERVEAKYGHIDGFDHRHHIDAVTGVLPRFPFGRPKSGAGMNDLDGYLASEMIDPSADAVLDDCDDIFLSVKQALQYHGHGRAVFAHVWGVFELSQFLFEKDGLPGTQDALMNMVAEKEKTKEIYLRLARWSALCAENAIQAGVDVIELSDDWGQQNTMLFSPKLWWEMIYPATKMIVDVARAHDVPVILHSDGDITLILDGVRELGVRGIHPVQESAGMSYTRTRDGLGDDICIMGGLDTVTALPVMTVDAVRTEVERVFAQVKDAGPFIFAGSHMFQDDAPLDVIEAAYERAFELAAF